MAVARSHQEGSVCSICALYGFTEALSKRLSTSVNPRSLIEKGKSIPLPVKFIDRISMIGKFDAIKSLF
jgi:hypothetical protein